ncbi:MAG: 2,3,4,5-tetrahydropyridine-2,6-dicarboxylate N-succinyltransferase, partial [Flavobacteriaceae bacterium]|nr:2,3,4,5-tetrahydropyridine-2,6-dicarboxylate N-succinyltransferase [Flavobacteriaceae bacterium]
MTTLQSIIEEAFEDRSEITPSNVSSEVKNAINETIEGLNHGVHRVASRIEGTQEWETHQWIKKAVLLSFRIEENVKLDAGYTSYFDKVKSKFANYSAEDFKTGGFRVVPNAMVRHGSFIGKNAVLMPSYVNIGAYIDSGTMVDTWATVGS